MEQEIKCSQVGMLSGGKWDKLHDISRRVYGADGLAPTLHTCGGGNLEPKILEPLALDEQNGYVRQDGCVGTLTTDGSSPKHNNRVVEPTIWGSLQSNCAKKKDGICPTLTSAMGNGGGQIPMHNYDYRIRKLTEKECGRLMGVKGDDCEKIAKNQSTSSQYHLYGDAICVSVLMAIFGSLLGMCDYEGKILNLVNELKQGD